MFIRESVLLTEWHFTTIKFSQTRYPYMVTHITTIVTLQPFILLTSVLDMVDCLVLISFCFSEIITDTTSKLQTIAAVEKYYILQALKTLPYENYTSKTVKKESIKDIQSTGNFGLRKDKLHTCFISFRVGVFTSGGFTLLLRHFLILDGSLLVLL